MHTPCCRAVRAIEQEQVLQLPSYAEGYFYLDHPPGERLANRLASHKRWSMGAAESLGLSVEETSKVEEGRDEWLHLLTPYTRKGNESVNGEDAKWGARGESLRALVYKPPHAAPHRRTLC